MKNTFKCLVHFICICVYMANTQFPMESSILFLGAAVAPCHSILHFCHEVWRALILYTDMTVKAKKKISLQPKAEQIRYAAPHKGTFATQRGSREKAQIS